ncbi:hypothetical protein LTR96_004755 [Exophiala xenobiotica]|nr:hypothetical protein LTR96_004755 [Exophiala xenobiotica]KAK5340376.1 hypothetical protein LTR98_003498 [Exophiala xenobiotica]
MAFPGGATNMMQAQAQAQALGQGRPTSVRSSPGRTTGAQRLSESGSSVHSGHTAPPGINVQGPPGPAATSSQHPSSLEPPPTPSFVVHPPPSVGSSAAQPPPPSPPSPASFAGGTGKAPTGKAPTGHSPSASVSSYVPSMQDQDNTFPMTTFPPGGRRTYPPQDPAYQVGESSANPYGDFPNPASSTHNVRLPYRQGNAPGAPSTPPPVRPPPPNPHASNTLLNRISGRGTTPIPTPPPLDESDADRMERFQNDNIEQGKRQHAQGQTGLYASTVLGFGLLGKMIPVNNASWVPTSGTTAVQTPTNMTTGLPTSTGGLPVMPRRFNPNAASGYTTTMLPDHLRPTQTTDPNTLTPEELAQLGQPQGQMLTFPPLGQTQTKEQPTPTPGQQPARQKRFNAPAQAFNDKIWAYL